MKFLQAGILRNVMLTAALAAGTAATHAVAANPLVRVSSTYGDFTVELLQDRAPATVQNFLGYVDRGDYSRVVVHRLDHDFVIQMGSHRWNGDCSNGVLPPACGPVNIPSQATVPNEPGVSNTAGTLAMAKIAGLPDSATSQWFINLRDNSNPLDTTEEGYTVFGQILGDGMDAPLRVNQLPDTVNMAMGVETLPIRDPATAVGGPSEKNLVLMNVWRVDRHSSSLHVFEFRTGVLSTYVDAGELGRMSLLLKVVGNTGTDTIFELDPTSLIPLAITPEAMATFSADDQRLRIPAVEVNDHGQVVIAHNVVLRLIDPNTWRFVLESYEVPATID